MKKRGSEGGMGRTVAVGDDGLDLFQLAKARLRLRPVEIESRQQGVGAGADAKVVLEEQHVRDLADMEGVFRFQTSRVVGGPECKRAKRNRLGCLQEGKDRDGAAGRFSGA